MLMPEQNLHIYSHFPKLQQIISHTITIPATSKISTKAVIKIPIIIALPICFEIPFRVLLTS